MQRQCYSDAVFDAVIETPERFEIGRARNSVEVSDGQGPPNSRKK